jgi:hypothetical protein
MADDLVRALGLRDAHLATTSANLTRPLFRRAARGLSGGSTSSRQLARFYNEDRAHTGRWTRGQPPLAVLGKGQMCTD